MQLLDVDGSDMLGKLADRLDLDPVDALRLAVRMLDACIREGAVRQCEGYPGGCFIIARSRHRPGLPDSYGRIYF